MKVQIVGTQKSRETKKALRFFKERGLKPQFTDLKAGKTAPGELGRFVQKFGLPALVNREGKAYEKSGLEYLRLSDEALLERLLADPALLVQPLVRSGNALTLGWDEAFWREAYEVYKDGAHKDGAKDSW